MSSLFGGNQKAPMGGAMGGAAGGGGSSERIEAAAAEIEMVADIFNKIVSSCHAKCITPRYIEPTLNKGEGVCVDRCVSKYFSVNEIVGKRLNAQASGQQAEPAQSSSGSFFGF